MAVSVASMSVFARLLISDKTSESFAEFRAMAMVQVAKASRNTLEFSVWEWWMKDVCPVFAKVPT